MFGAIFSSEEFSEFGVTDEDEIFISGVEGRPDRAIDIVVGDGFICAGKIVVEFDGVSDSKYEKREWPDWEDVYDSVALFIGSENMKPNTIGMYSITVWR